MCVCVCVICNSDAKPPHFPLSLSLSPARETRFKIEETETRTLKRITNIHLMRKEKAKRDVEIFSVAFFAELQSEN